MRPNSPPAFGIMFSLSPYAHEPEPDEDALDRETHDVSEHEDGELHLRQFHSKAEVRKHVECLKTELAYYEALLSGNERDAQRARQQLYDAMGDEDGE